MIFTIIAFFILNLFKSRTITIVLVVLSVTVSTRYLYWRLTETLQFETLAEMFLGTNLFLAELYAFMVLILGFVQSIWPLRRQPVPLPEDISVWPSVDVYIPTYNETLQVVSNTVLGAMAMDYPRDRMRVYLLDDGRRPEFAAFAEEVGCGYITRDDNKFAKAGNLNHAMTRTDSDLIAIFDSDHIPTRAFLQMTVGSFLENENVALVQTPHHFYSPDPFERNVSGGSAVPNEGQLFYGLVQEGNDFWNSAFFCGSCAVLRREALDDVGGFATETVTEDAHTALKMHRRGWDSIYVRLPLAAGLATERLALHIGQRMRWARGMTQIFRLDNPLFGRGLTLAQRLCYLNAMLHFFFALPRFVFLTAPLAYLLFAQNIITSSWQLIFLYAFPHLIHSVLTNSRLQAQHRYTFWGEIYESVLSFHILRPTLYTLINPRRGSFNVTEKGGLLPQSFFDTSRVVPHMVLAGFLIMGLILGILRILLNEADLQFLEQVDVGVIVLNMVWAAFNLIVVLAAISVARERRQVREHVRVPVHLDTQIVFADGETVDTRSIDISMGGSLIEVQPHVAARIGENVRLDISTGSEVLPVIGEIVGVRGDEMRVRFNDVSLEQQRNLVRLVFGRADAWLSWDNHRADTIWRSFGAIFRGIGGMFGSGRGARARATALAVSVGLGALVAAMPWDSLAQQGDLAPPPPLDNRAVIQSPLAPPPAPIGAQPVQQQFGAAPVAVNPAAPAPIPMRPSREQPGRVRGQADGVAGQLRPNEPLNAVVPNANIESSPVVLVPMDAPSQRPGPIAPAPDGSLETATLRSFNVEPNMKMISVKGLRFIPFTLRSDQVVDQARLSLSYDYSPSLLPELSNLSVMLNGAPIGKLRLLRSYAGGATIQLPINAALFKEENVLLLETDKHYTTDCEDPVHESLWLRVDTKASRLEMAVRPLPLVDDLSILPRPFVDVYDYEPEPLTFLLPPNPSDTVLQAAGVVASYFGDAGRKHGIEISARYSNLGNENAVVFVSGANAPGGINAGSVGGSQIWLLANPNNPQGSKVLIIAGSDDGGVLQAAQHLALGARSGLRGPAVQVNAAPSLKEHEVDDAARWISLKEPVPLASLVRTDEELQGVGVTGFLSAPFVMPPRRLPDEQGGPTLRVEYEYPKAPFLDKNTSRFDILLSNEFVKTISLQPSETIDRVSELARGATDEEGRNVVRIDPSVFTGPRNELQFFFSLLPKLGKCEGKMPPDMRFRVQRSSTIDFSDTIHYTPLPDIASFATVGYPYTRKADLSETVIVVPQSLSEDEASAYLNVMALMGEATGDPATRVSVTRPGGLDSFGSQDVLVIGAWRGIEGQIVEWNGGGPFVYEGNQLRVKSVSPIDSVRYFLSGTDDLSGERDRANTVLAGQGQGFSGMVSFERPGVSDRTVVVLSGATPEETLELTRRMRDAELVDSFKGDLIKMDTKGVTSFAVGPQFTVYSIPFWQRLRWYFADRPLLLIALLVVGVALLSMILVWLLQRIAAARVQDARAE
jgi:cellulose synthase (UDP-forming)